MWATEATVIPFAKREMQLSGNQDKEGSAMDHVVPS